MRASFLFLFLLTLSAKLFAQVQPDSAAAANVVIPIKTSSFNPFNHWLLSPYDTSMQQSHLIGTDALGLFQDLANNGSALQPLQFSLKENLLANNLLLPFQPYLHQYASQQFFKTNKKLSHIQFYQRSNKENAIKLIHSQNILKNWNLSFDIKRAQSPGFMLYHTTYQSLFNFNTWYHSLNKRYHLMAWSSIDNIKNRANGGLVNDSLLTSTPLSNLDLKAQPVNINDRALIRNRCYGLMQHYGRKGFYANGIDSSKNIILTHLFNYQKLYYRYEDNNTDSNFYSDNFFEGLKFDSIFTQTFSNHVYLNFVFNDKVKLTTGAQHQWLNYFQRGGNRIWNETKANATLTAHPLAQLTAIVDYQTRLDTALHSWHAQLYYKMKKHAISVAFSSAVTTPYRNQINLQSRRFIWQNNFFNTNSNSFQATAALFNAHLTIDYALSEFTNLIYYNQAAIPVQALEKINYSAIHISGNAQYKNWYASVRFISQTSSNDAAIRVPAQILRADVHYQNHFFKKALLAQLGITSQYVSTYFADAFMPATQVFYRQNTIESQGKPIVDIYTSLKIKRAIITFKINNVSHQLLHTYYTSTPYYTPPGRTITLGINWLFFD
ncbi:MAG: hypothetical protein RIQ89_2100 [Bacteroidota bacterium]|jgi:hypothetical protein